MYLDASSVIAVALVALVLIFIRISWTLKEIHEAIVARSGDASATKAASPRSRQGIWIGRPVASRFLQLKPIAARHCWNGFTPGTNCASRSASVNPLPPRGSSTTGSLRNSTRPIGRRSVLRHATSMASRRRPTSTTS